MNRLKTYACTTLLLAMAAPLAAQTEWTSGRPDGHAPIGVMGDHTHEAGEFMFSYRFMRMAMEGSLDGSDEVANEDIVSPTGYGFMVTPTEMPMTMHMIGMMYAPSDRVTLMVMANILDMSMDHLMRNGNTFTTESGGFGDLGLGALVGIVDEGSSRLHLNANLTVPTGSITEMDATPMSGGNDVQLPYAMQTGTGTVALAPGLTWLGMAERVSWGAQGRLVFQLGENDRGYTAGDRAEGTVWFGVRASERLSLSARARYQVWDDFSGMDSALNPMMVPTARTDLRGGKRLDLPVGVNYWINSGALSGLRILAEYEIPVWQDLSGPQLESTGTFTVGVQLSVDPG